MFGLVGQEMPVRIQKSIANRSYFTQEIIFSLPSALSKQEGIERMELPSTLIKFYFSWGKPWWSSHRGRYWEAPVSSRDGVFQGRTAAHRIAEAPGSFHLLTPRALQLCSDDFPVLFNDKIFLALYTLPRSGVHCLSPLLPQILCSEWSHTKHTPKIRNCTRALFILQLTSTL